MQSSGGNMNAAQLARLQQQLAQYGRGQPGQQQQMMNANAIGGMGNAQQQQQQQLQQAYIQQQLQQSGQQGIPQARRNPQLAGIGNNPSAALAMMQQQQGNNQMGTANMSTYINVLQNQGSSGAMDASSASGAQLAALAGINMGGGHGMGNQANNMLLGSRSTSQGQVQGMGSNQQMQGMGQTNNAAFLQQQIAHLQLQLERQQQQQNQNQGMGNMGMPLNHRSSTSSQGFGMQQNQQQIFQQMQQHQQMGNDQFPSMAAMMGQNSSQQMPNVQRNSMGGSLQGLNGQQDLMLQQQQQLLRSSGQNDPFSNKPQDRQDNSDLMGRSSRPMPMESLNQSQQQNNNTTNAFGNFDMDASTNSQRSSTRSQQQPDSSSGIPPLDIGDNQIGDKKDDINASQKSFLDGSFAGGWQSNADIPDRRRIIFSILDVIRQMRPDTNKISQKLPHMAKSLEEHLYRSAQTKEEYLDPLTLKKRLQLIAHGLELHRSTSSTSEKTDQNANNNSITDPSSNTVPSESQQLQQFLEMQGNNIISQGSGMPQGTSMSGMVGGNISVRVPRCGVGMDDNSNSTNEQMAAQKKKVIRQQQQRLLLLRHASKCKEGPNCKTKFCKQMMTLWKHMKKCRDKNCETSHCLSSRMVLNHYRICKSQGRTETCEVCGPVMIQIHRQEQEGNMDSSDPLAAKPDPGLSNNAMPQIFVQQPPSDAEAMQQQAMQQLYQKQHKAIQQNHQMPNMMGIQNNLDSLQGLGNSLQNDGLQALQQAQNPQVDSNVQEKLQQQQQVLRHLQKQQASLLEQQKQLQEQQQNLKDPGTEQGQQLQAQHHLLQQLQRRCQQQQAFIQQELLLAMNGIQQGGQANQQMGNNRQNSQQNQQAQQIPIVRQASTSSQNQDQSQLQAQMQALSQSHMEALNNNKDNSGMNQMGDMQSQIQNQMLQVQSTNQDQLQETLMQQALGEQGGMLDQQQSTPQQPQQQNDPEPAVSGSPSDTFDNIAEQLDTSEKSASKPAEVAPKARPVPSVSRGKGARSRGGKGKRLRDIADDLLPAGSAAAVRAGASINLPSAEVGADSVHSKKRSAGEMGEDAIEESSSKTPKTDFGLLGGPDGQGSTNVGEGEDSSEDGKVADNESNASLPESMTKGFVEQNLMLLHKGLHLTSRTIAHKCLPIVQQLIDDSFGWVFRDAVDPVVFGLPDYFEVVKNPMHLLLIKKKLENAVYTDMASFERDVMLVFENSILYNGKDSEVGQLAHTMIGVFEKEYKKVCEVKVDLHTIDANACKLCGNHQRQFEPPVLYCATMSCSSPRIKRNATYYTYGSNQNCWCEGCYSKLKANELITLNDGGEIYKSRLLRAKHDSLPEEGWIECDDCKAPVHQICALHNCRLVKPNSKFRCPKCVLVRRGTREPTKLPNRAKDLPKSRMSDFIERGMEASLVAAYEKKAEKAKIKLEDVEKAKGLCIRVISHIETKHVVREEMYKRYSRNGCPSEFPVHTKCVGIFQSINGVDVLLFAMYVYEYGDDCPAPNRRRVYISYLDSVQYFHPKEYRSIVYQSIIVEYLRFVKERGFHTAHIWSCSPAPGDEYVFYSHPSHQKVPGEDMLRNWYYKTLDKAKAEGIVVETVDLYDEYFKSNGKNTPVGFAPDPMSLPYFEGDYIPGEIEKIISQMSKEETRLPVAESSQQKAAIKRAGSKLGTRSNPGNLMNHFQDKVMLRLGNAIYNMKENFIIVRLRNKRFVAAVDRGDDVSGWPDDDEFEPPGKDSSVLNRNTNFDSNTDSDEDFEEREKEERNGKDKGLENKERSECAVFAMKLVEVSCSFKKIGNTVDADTQFESELFENRQLFLNYCQTNHCQFDELRRAKHSTMMVLYQLHNPKAPKFVSQCGSCFRNITNGTRYHCNNCANFDLCHECYRPVTSGHWANRGSRFTHNSEHKFSPIIVENSLASQQQQAEQTKNLQGYLKILNHAAFCSGPPACKLNNCIKMKNHIAHVKTCEITHEKGCKICTRLLTLIIVHARSCNTRSTCPLPFCDRIRERNERLRWQQRLMDDRRRNAQNEFYRSSRE